MKSKSPEEYVKCPVFNEWLRDVTPLLPLNFTLHEAVCMYARKIKDEEAKNG